VEIGVGHDNVGGDCGYSDCGRLVSS